jgi:hypothetical protein
VLPRDEPTAVFRARDAHADPEVYATILPDSLSRAGIPDRPVITIQQPCGWRIGFRSLYQMASRAVEEGPTTLLWGRGWRDPAEGLVRLAALRGGAAVSSRVTDPGGSLVVATIRCDRSEEHPTK